VATGRPKFTVLVKKGKGGARDLLGTDADKNAGKEDGEKK
jgi:hypothetical protein